MNLNKTVADQSNSSSSPGVIWLDDLDVSTIRQAFGAPHARRSVNGTPLTLNGKVYERGVGTHANSKMKIALGGRAAAFEATVGVDDEIGTQPASLIFRVYADDALKFDSGVMRWDTPAQAVRVPLAGAQTLVLIVRDAGDGNICDHADWADARLLLVPTPDPSTASAGEFPRAVKFWPDEPAEILTPTAPATPRINGPRVLGARPGHEFFHTIPVTGERPLTISVDGLPAGLRLNAERKLITGAVAAEGTYPLTIRAANAHGVDEAPLRLVIAPDALALTPPLGWNSWNCWGRAVDAAKIRAAADAMADSGLMVYGWTYINVDDCWHGERDPETGVIRGNDKFPDMAGLAAYVHSRGLKFGLYTDVGPKTCAGYPGSLGFEDVDARTYGEWGVDFVKVDWCFSEGLEPEAAYRHFGDALRAHAGRDIIFSICNWGDREPWRWGRAAGGQCWRTTGDIYDDWDCVKEIGFQKTAGLGKFAGPGGWNDPDMMVLGRVGWGETQRPTRLSPNEQYSHMTLWVIIASPILLGHNLAEMDAFTLGLLTNHEVMAVHQDERGHAGDLVAKHGLWEIWARDLADGGKAVGVFYVGGDDYQVEDYPAEIEVALDWAVLGLAGPQRARDIWRQKDLSVVQDGWRVTIPHHGVKFLKFTTAR